MKSTPSSFKPNLAVVTGASRGIGAAIANKLSQNGFQVVALSRNPHKSTTPVSSKKGGRGIIHALQCDVSKRVTVEKTFSKIEKQLGIPGIIINNAGMGGPFHRVDEVSDDEWNEIFTTNLSSIFYTSRILLPKMKAHHFGRIVNISSIQGLFGGALSSTYAATKHAVIGYTKAIAAEWGPYGITCNAVCPGYIETPLLKNRDEKVSPKSHLAKLIPTKRLGTPAEVAALVLYLVNSESGYTNGGSYVIDGGLTAQVGSGTS